MPVLKNMRVVVHRMNLVIQSLIFSMKKGTKYKINTFSWFVADIALYSSVFLLYLLLGLGLDNFGDYSKAEMLLYISTYSLVNNLYAVLFSEGVSAYSENIMNGYFVYDLLLPKRVLFSTVMKTINFPPLLSTPFLIGINVCLLLSYSLSASVVALYILSLIAGAFSILFLFVILYTFQLFKVRTAVLSGLVLDMLELSEKPDSVFPKKVRDFFTFIIPAFLMSALPSRIVLGRISVFELLWVFSAPFFLYGLFRLVFWWGIRKYESEVE